MAWNPEFESLRHQVNLEAENEPALQQLDRVWDEDNAPEVEEDPCAECNHDGEDDDGFDSGDVVRIFMRDAEAEFDFLDQARVVEQFCRGASLEALRDGEYDCAEGGNCLLDDRENKPRLSSGATKPLYQGSARPCKGPLTPRELLEELGLPVSGRAFTEPRTFAHAKHVRCVSASLSTHRRNPCQTPIDEYCR